MKIYLKRLEDNGLYLEEIDEKSLEKIRVWRNENINNRTFITNKYITKEAQSEWYRSYKKISNDIMYIIYFEGIQVGTIALYKIDLIKKEAEIGRILIGELDFRGKEIAYRAMNILCNFAFNALKLNRITLNVMNNNISAINLYKKIGFKKYIDDSSSGQKILIMELINK